MSQNFYVGDRVILNKEVPGNLVLCVGDLGTVCSITTSGNVGVAWDRYDKYGLHSCEGSCEDGHGWYFGRHASAISLFQEDDISISDQSMEVLLQ